MQGRILIILIATISTSVALDAKEYDSLRAHLNAETRKDKKIFLRVAFNAIYKDFNDFSKKIRKDRRNNRKIERPLEIANTLNGFSQQLGQFSKPSILSNDEIDHYIATLKNIHTTLVNCENSSEVWSKSCGMFKKHFEVNFEKLLPTKTDTTGNEGEDVKLFINIDHNGNTAQPSEHTASGLDDKDVKLFVKVHMDEDGNTLNTTDVAKEIAEQINKNEHPEELFEDEYEDDLPDELPEHSIIQSKSDIANEDDLDDFESESVIDYQQREKKTRSKNTPTELLPHELDRLFAEKKVKNQPMDLYPDELNHLFADNKHNNGPLKKPNEKRQKTEPADLQRGELNRLYKEKSGKVEYPEIDLADLFAKLDTPNIDNSAIAPKDLDVPNIKRHYSRITTDFEDEDGEPKTPEKFDTNNSLIVQDNEAPVFVGPRRRHRKIILLEKMNCMKCLNDSFLSFLAHY
jgi:hypothetical protein